MTTRAQFAWNKVALLAVLDHAHRVNPAAVTNVAIQKLLFLTELEGRKENIKAAYYRFFRYKHGPFSTELSWNIAEFEKGALIDSENGELLDRGKYLLDYVLPEIKNSDLGADVIGIIAKTSEKWKNFRGWSIVKEVYKLKVPVDDYSGKIVKIKDIPEKVDIIIPERSHEREFNPFPDDLVEDICTELSIPAARLDPSSEELRHVASESLAAALARS